MQVTQQVEFWQRFQQMPVVGICRNVSLNDLMYILPLYKLAGLHAIEITMNTPDASRIIRTLVKKFGSELNIGAGTVCSAADLEMALSAGATFIVTPVVNEKIIQGCRIAKTPVFAGAFTPTEIFQAWSYGADVVKLFPSSGISLEFIRDIKGPFPQIPLLPTGGINLDNCADFIMAGATGVGIGNQLINKKIIASGNREALQKHFQAYASRIKNALTSRAVELVQSFTTHLPHSSISTDRK